ncbi:ACT domain-containing protein [Pseudoalteromonas luteoviolacea]|uniref:Amino acid-binding protein n=1 Tax=Pseudoalteromonas luteoviolacea S4054 TaxID=1129367 RepID=A0A0F6ABA0_9GAMM|nr:ACT domain-containing protein [Pseudoalteromonas luteoviolacea]AOT08557.1 amino acid-binding protein [Pseudoalteromonas luteoviolacea]AOT13473.1 amino acid-binding protein [Pseudoalteromonas luteoviolacea]AOT18386.1 amino acid-binding protein [Pseudoalteromonas luteoviolacea]KKE83445.1 amino acid-binding protein [Pseudoalteromonas luteoviolacea S4054]KZN75882.1 amino acid-binding protein [Pseudoalteromonas luteoviolacea S4047-1]
MSKQTLQILQQDFTIHSLDNDAEIPAQVLQSDIFFIAKTTEELSIVCPSDIKVESFAAEPYWRAIEIIGPLGFSLTGIMSNISGVLASANVSIFSISTYDTDYILVKEQQLNNAIQALRKDGYLFV